MARRRVDHQARRLVDDDHVVVLVHHVQGQGLGPGQGGPRRGHGEVEPLARPDPVGGVAHRPRTVRGAHHQSGQDQRLEPRARERRHGVRQQLVQPRPGLVLGDRNGI